MHTPGRETRLLKNGGQAHDAHRRSPKLQSFTAVRKGKCHMSHLQPAPTQPLMQSPCPAEAKDGLSDPRTEQPPGHRCRDEHLDDMGRGPFSPGHDREQRLTAGWESSGLRPAPFQREMAGPGGDAQGGGFRALWCVLWPSCYIWGFAREPSGQRDIKQQGYPGGQGVGVQDGWTASPRLELEPRASLGPQMQ